MNFLKIFKAGFIWCGILLSFTCYGQELVHSGPMGVMPMQINPSFAGESGAGRLSSNASYSRYYSDSKNFNNYYSIISSYDQFVPALRSGIGVTTGYGGNISSYNDGSGYFFSLAIAPKFSINGKYTLSPSLDVSYGSENSENHPGDFPAYVYTQKSLEGRAGILINSNKFYAGYTVRLISQEKEVYNNLELPDKKLFQSHLHLGYSFQRSSESKFSFTPQIAFAINEKIHPDDPIIFIGNINLTFRYKIYIAGINGSGIHAGIQNNRLKVMLTSRIPDSSDYGFTGGDISFRYIFKKADKGLDQSRF